MHLSLRSFAVAASVALVLPSTIVGAQATASGTATPAQSAPISGVRYEVTFDATTARARTLRVGMTFDVGGPGPVLLSLPAWTPGAYEISNFARWILNFAAVAGDRSLAWDKLDYDTWRVQPRGARSVTIRFDYVADSLDNAMSWARPD